LFQDNLATISHYAMETDKLWHRQQDLKNACQTGNQKGHGYEETKTTEQA